MSEQLALPLDAPGLDPAIVAGLRTCGWRLVRSATIDGELRFWFTGREQKRQMCGPGRFLPLPPLCKTAAGAAAMLKELESERR